MSRAERLSLLAVSSLLVVIAASRQEFIGDGVRHLGSAITSGAPALGAPRWLFFPPWHGRSFTPLL